MVRRLEIQRKYCLITLDLQFQSLSATAANNYSLWKFTKNFDRPHIPNPSMQLKDKKVPGFHLITKEVLLKLLRKAIVLIATLFSGTLR